MLLDPRIDMSEGADGAGKRGGRHFLARRMEATAGAGKLGEEGCELEAEGGRLGVDAVAPPDHRRVLVLVGALLERGEQSIDVGGEEVGGVDQLKVEAGVENVGRRQALVDEARFRTDDLGKMGQEGDDVVLDLALDRIDPRHVEDRALAPLTDDLGGLLRHHADLGHGVERMRLDLEPDAEPCLRRPDRRHFRARIARYHRRAPCCCVCRAV